MNEKEYKGLSISKGTGFGRPYFLVMQEDSVPDFSIKEVEVDQEISRFRKALVSSKEDLQYLQRSLVEEGSPEIVAILDTHLEMLQDPLITEEIEKKIRNTSKNAESVFLQVITDYKSRIASVEDSFFQERVRDITDVSKRVLSHLRPFKKVDLKMVPMGSVLLAEDLIPSIIAEANPNQIVAFVTKYGGVSSHAAIIARAKGIPFVAGIEMEEILEGEIEELIVDGTKGKVVLNPLPKTRETYEKIHAKSQEYYEMLEKEAHLDAETTDGYSVRIYGNLENMDDIDQLISTGASGIGLFRSEYLFLSKDRFPTEEEQYAVYKEILQKLPEHPVVIRVFDVGGDKKIEGEGAQKDPFLKREMNPVLGCRAIRFLLRYEELFESQLRALLRASTFGNIHILIPMVSDVSEIRAVKHLIEKIREELLAKDIPVKEKIPIGCMIEVPSSAIMCDTIAEEVDFLSIGTNDLIQYVVAADRSNPHISYLYSPAHPSILRLLRVIVSAANRHKKRLILCGEVASDPKYIPLLLGAGIRELSVIARSIPVIKHAIRGTSIVEASHLAEEAFTFTSVEELYAFMSQN